MAEYEQLPGDGQKKFISTGNRKKGGAGLFVLGLLIGVIAAAIGVGIFFGLQGGSLAAGTGSSGPSKGSAVNDQSSRKLTELEKVIETNYYWSDEVTKEQKENGLYKGLLESLGDPYSVYYTPEELQELTMDTQGIYYGIGAYVSQDPETGYGVISGVIKN